MSSRVSHGLRPQISLPILSFLVFSAPAFAQETPRTEEPKTAHSGQAENPAAPEQITVRGTRFIEEDMYVQQSSSAGNKDDTLLKDTAQSVSVVSQGQVKDQGAQSVQQATRYVAGVLAEPFGTDIRGDYVTIRGTQAGMFRDGMQTLFSTNVTQTRFPVFGAEKIEVLRGPSSMLYGQSPIGGLVNVITKIPRAEEKGEVRLELSSFNRSQASVDLMGAVTDDKTVSFRVVSQVRDSDTYVKHASDDSVYFAPSLRWQPNADTSLTLLMNYQRDDGVPTAQFVPLNQSLLNGAPGKVRRDTFLGEPGFDEQVTEQRSISILYDQAFNSVWSYHQNLRFTDTKTSYQQVFKNWGASVDPVTNTLARTSYAYKSETQSFKIDGHLRAVVDNNIAPTKFMFGVDYQKGDIDAKSGFPGQNPINPYQPTYGSYTVPAFTEVKDYKQSQVGVYAQADVELTETTKMILGVRHDKAKTEGEAWDKVDDSATTSRAALIQEVAPNTNVYASYAESFTPNYGADRNNEAFDSRKGKQFELGSKYQNANALATIAYFQTTETNRLTSDPLSTTFTSLAQGESKIRGVEIEATYDLTSSISGNGSYSWLKSEVTDSNNPLEEGKRLANTPDRMGSLWLNYRFIDSVLAGTKAGIGARYVGQTYDGLDNYGTPSYTLYDAVVSYTRGKWELAFNGNNLADKTYLTSCRSGSSMDCFYGQSRTLSATTAYHF